MRWWKMGLCERSKLAAMTVVAVLATTACSGDPTEPPASAAFVVQAAGGGSGVQVMTQNVVQNPVMDAFFQGTIIADHDGCLRLADEEGPTVVWPVGYIGESAGGETLLLDGDGKLVGRVGGSFSFGGGAVPELRETLGFSQEDRDLAEQLCPGRFWIVAP